MINENKPPKKSSIGTFVTADFYKKVDAYALKRGLTIAQVILEILREETGLEMARRSWKRPDKKKKPLDIRSFMSVTLTTLEKEAVKKVISDSPLNDSNWIRQKVYEKLKSEGVELGGIRIH